MRLNRFYGFYGRFPLAYGFYRANLGEWQSDRHKNKGITIANRDIGGQVRHAPAVEVICRCRFIFSQRNGIIVFKIGALSAVGT